MVDNNNNGKADLHSISFNAYVELFAQVRQVVSKVEDLAQRVDRERTTLAEQLNMDRSDRKEFYAAIQKRMDLQDAAIEKTRDNIVATYEKVGKRIDDTQAEVKEIKSSRAKWAGIAIGMTWATAAFFQFLKYLFKGIT